MAGSTGSAREEAERLVATVLAMAEQSGLSDALRGRPHPEKSGSDGTGATRPEGLGALGDTLAGVVGQFTGRSRPHRPAEPTAAGAREDRSAPHQQSEPPVAAGWSTGSAECCVCPVCRAIAGLRNPNPGNAERLATGAGDFAVGVAGLLRAFSAVAGSRPKPPARPARPAPPQGDPAWSAATRHGRPEQPVVPGPDDIDGPWSAATRTPAPPPPPAADGASAGGTADTDGRADDEVVRTPPAPGADPWAAATAAPVPAAEAPAVDVASEPVRPGPGPAGAAVGSAGARTSRNDVWAAAVADSAEGGVAAPPDVDDDERTPDVRAPVGGTTTGSAPGAAVAGDPDGGAGDEARPGDGV